MLTLLCAAVLPCFAGLWLIRVRDPHPSGDQCCPQEVADRIRGLHSTDALAFVVTRTGICVSLVINFLLAQRDLCGAPGLLPPLLCDPISMKGLANHMATVVVLLLIATQVM